MSTPSQANCVAFGFYHCLTPQQVETAYNLAPLYRHGITGKGETIVIVDSFGSPTIKQDLAVFDQQFKLPAPPSFKIITPAGKIPKWNPDDSDMTGWGGETTLDVEYAHTIAPGANILLVETPVSETEGVTGFPQIVEAENYVVKHHLGGVISQSFSATEQTFTGLGQINRYHLRSAYVQAAEEKDGPTVLAASGDSGVADVGLDRETYYTHRVTSWPDSDPLVTGVGGTELVAGKGNTYTSVAWNDTYNPHLGDGTVPYATGGGLSVLFSRPFYQDGVKNVVGSARGVPDVSMNGACSSPVFTYQSFPQTGHPGGLVPVLRHQRGDAGVRRHRGARQPGRRPPPRPHQPDAVLAVGREGPRHRARHLGQQHRDLHPGHAREDLHDPGLHGAGRLQPGRRCRHRQRLVPRLRTGRPDAAEVTARAPTPAPAEGRAPWRRRRRCRRLHRISITAAQRSHE